MKTLFKAFTLVIVMMALNSCNVPSQKVFTENDIQIIPKPVSTVLGEGSFTFNKNTKFQVTSEDQRSAAAALTDRFSIVAGFSPEIITEGQSANNAVIFVVDEKLKEDAYELSIKKDQINIKAGQPGGFLYGVQTLRQLLPTAIESQNIEPDIDWSVPVIKVKDHPRFKWRGLMLDVSRHFFKKDYIKEVIDGLARHKMNVLHFHLVDDQGWRIEIKKYPKLTEIGAWRVDHEDKHWNARPKASRDEKGTYGGFYTQDDIREIIAYAQSKNIEVVPEIEMPAHVSSAIASYPELACFDNPVPISVPSGGVWPITDIYCAGKEHTFEFLENVLLEVMELFPSKYIHIGGDEATKTNWKKCPHCQRRMKTENLKSEEELQSYFIRRMERFLSIHDRVLIGWDEILEGGLAPGATVMSWRGVKGGLEAANDGHEVVMTPNSHCYFDHYQGPQGDEPLAIGGYLPLNKVYQFDPVVESMTEEQASYVLGGQANLWAEYIPTTSHSEYMIYPRLAALSEAVWSPKESRDWQDFSTRVQTMFERYDYQRINYAKSAYLITAKSDIDISTQTVGITLENELLNPDIRYETNGSAPKHYTEPIKLSETTTIKASLYKNDQPVGKAFTKTFDFHKGTAKKVTYTDPPHEKYQGAGDYTLVNVLRGTTNFHDGQWQGWLDQDMEVVIELGALTNLSKVTMGVLESQGPAIYSPTSMEVYLSEDGKTFTKAGTYDRPFAQNGTPELQDFVVSFEEQQATHVKVKATCLKEHPFKEGSFWLFVDEIVLE
ncbi:family 20 glycosylhydrolase [Fulvivirgaceae bacterium BMA10]|uniref:beta-N-acetylhexosaminidase n=1 Tax=Splendidivirga corallicola TaxID=3051826 RepID=A0ABT8KN36_9BACT|nr:family 20 glycosylhydrolase [Fulvivirgaceae bacterium BMA10]